MQSSPSHKSFSPTAAKLILPFGYVAHGAMEMTCGIGASLSPYCIQSQVLTIHR